MKGVYTALGVIGVVFVLISPLKVCAQALPNFPSATQAQLQLVEAQAENLTLAQEGVQPYGQVTESDTATVASILTLFDGLYRGLQSWNEWQGGDDYIVRRQAVLEHTQLPDWLADYSGEVIMWELEYFGHTVTMLTNPQYELIVHNGNKALNVTIKNEMREASAQYKVENPNPSRMNKPRGQASYSTNDLSDTNNNSVFQWQKPYIQGNSLFFTVSISGTPHLIRLEDFTNTVIASYALWGSVYNPFFKIDAGKPSHSFVFYDVTIGQQLETYPSQGAYTFKFPTEVLPYQYTASVGQIQYFLPMSYYGPRSTSYPNFGTGRNVNCYGLGSSYFAVISGCNESTRVPYGLYIDVGAGQTTTGTTNIKIPSNGTISAQSLEEIQDAISAIEPEVDPQTGIEILPIPDAFPEAENLPLEVEEPEPPIPAGIEDFPTSDPSQVPEQDPQIDPSTTPTEDTLPDSAEQIQPMEELQLVTGLQNRFPFSIPWDIYNAYKMLQAEKQPPEWEWEMKVNLPTGGVFTHTFTLSMEPVDSLVTLFRDLFLLAFILGLAIYSYNKFFGGGA